jgi:hypothetical protein
MMSTVDILGILGTIVGILSLASSIFVGVAVATKKWREGVVKELENRSFGVGVLEQAARAWVAIFERYFGDRLFSARQLVTVPLYTLGVSLIYILVWILHNVDGNVFAIFGPFSPLMKQALYDYFHEAIFVALVVDIFSISLTRIAIRAGKAKGFLSFRFLLIFMLTVAVSFIIFTFGLFFMRVLDMVRLYADHAPQDPLPIMPYRPLDGFDVLFNLFNAPTIMHVTSRGVFSTYFIPEPVLFYTALTSQLSFVFIIASHLLAKFSQFVRRASVRVLQAAGTTKGSANGIFVSMMLWMLAITFFFGIVAFHWAYEFPERRDWTALQGLSLRTSRFALAFRQRIQARREVRPL